jgi:hypothetical protein
MMGMGTFGAHPALLGGHHPYGDMGLPGMGPMGIPGMSGLGAMSGLLQANGVGHSLLGMGVGLPSGLAGSKPHGLGSHDGGSSENLLSSESGRPGGGGGRSCLAAGNGCARQLGGLLTCCPVACLEE